MSDTTRQNTPKPRRIDAELLQGMPLPAYDDDADKSVYGKLLIVAGSRNCPGAALLAAEAALRTGCGTVRVAAPESVALAMGLAVPELYIVPLPETDGGTVAATALPLLEKQFGPCRAILLGPGLGDHPETLALCRELIAHAPLPMLIDAQALSALKEGLSDNGSFPAPRLVTPHAREMARLCGLEPDAVKADCEGTALGFASRYQVTTVLKGKHTLIATPAGGLSVNTAGTRGLGTAGSGDVLAGVIAGLLTQGLAPEAAAAWGVHLHARAGEGVAKEIGDDGLMARDLLRWLPVIQRQLREQTGRKGPMGFRI